VSEWRGIRKLNEVIADLVLVLGGGERVVEAFPFGIAGVYILNPDLL